MRKSYYTIALLLSFLVTVGVLHFWQSSVYPFWIWLLLGFFGFLGFIEIFLHMYSCTGTRVHVVGILLLCFTIGSSLAFLRVAQTTHVTTPADIEAFANRQEVIVRGRIVDAPDRRPLKTRYTVEVLELRSSTRSGDVLPLSSSKGQHDVTTPRNNTAGALHATPIPVTGKILATDYAAWPRHEYGDDVIVRGVLERPEPFDDFAYDRYLSRFGIYAIISRAEIETLSSGQSARFAAAIHGSTGLTINSSQLRAYGSQIFATLIHLRERFEAQINRILPEPHASFLAGLLTGSRRGLPEHVLEDFRATGLTHIIAVSGANVAIVLEVIAAALFFLPLRFRLLPSLLGLVFFTLFTGASPSVVRAAIMGALGLFALQRGRERHTLIAILVAAALMASWNPKLLWHDAGFQLSFLSVLGLAFFNPFLERPARIVPNVLGMREAFRMTIAAQIAAIPLVAFLFGEFSLVAPLANVLIAPFVPFAMLAGAASVFVSFLAPPLGLLLAYPVFGALEAVLSIARFLGSLPEASLPLSLSPFALLGYYALLMFVLWGLRNFFLTQAVRKL